MSLALAPTKPRAPRKPRAAVPPCIVPMTDDDIIASAMRILDERMRSNAPVFSTPSLVKDYLRMHFAGLEHETFVVLFLSYDHRLLSVESMFRGTVAQTAVYPREVVKASLARNASAVILAHNHPSGVAEPSRADEYLTQTLKSALALVDVRILDHFVVGGTSVVSFAERGLL